jgi:PAS domain S-box-containing protein
MKEADDTHRGPTTTFLVDLEEGDERLSASELLGRLEEGAVTLDTPVRVTAGAAPKPVRLYLRELVWQSYERDGDVRGLEQVKSPFRTAFEHAPVGLAVTDLLGQIVRANVVLETMLGYGSGELDGRPVSEFSHPDDREEETRLAGELFAGLSDSFRMEKRFLARGGEVVPTELVVALVHDDEGRPASVIGTIVDLRQRQALQRRMTLGERMRTVGRMARGIAYDFNDMMTVIKATAQLALTEAEGALKEDLEAIEHAANRASDITRQLMMLARAQESEEERLDLGAVILGLKDVLRGIVEQQGQLTLDIADQSFPIFGAQMQLEQVVLNLTMNASAAITAGGQVVIRLTRAGDTSNFGRIEVIDDGCGMSPDTLERAFEPFFSARTKGQGAGLGLSTAYTVAEAHGGNVRLHSTLGEGTTCEFLLPLSLDDDSR